MAYKKLIALGAAVTTLATYTFAFNDYHSQDSLIRKGIDNLKQVALGYKSQLEKLQGEYDSLLGDLNSTQDALMQARLKLQSIYQKITGTEWSEANGDILDFDFDSLLKDGEQFDNNVDGDAIADILGLPHGATTEQIIAAIQDLIATVQSLEARIVQLEGQVTDLESQIAEYETEQDSLVEEINGLKDKLDEATAQANAIIDSASQEEQAQLDYLNTVLVELGEEAVADIPEGEEVPTLESVQAEIDSVWAQFTPLVAGDSSKFTAGRVEMIRQGSFTLDNTDSYKVIVHNGSDITLSATEEIYNLLSQYRTLLDQYNELSTMQ